jgi:hypothetical protein
MKSRKLSAERTCATGRASVVTPALHVGNGDAATVAAGIEAHLAAGADQGRVTGGTTASGTVRAAQP